MKELSDLRGRAVWLPAVWLAAALATLSTSMWLAVVTRSGTTFSGVVFFASFLTMCHLVAITFALHNSWLKWPSLVFATLVIGSIPSFITGYSDFINFQMQAIATIFSSIAVLILVQYCFGTIGHLQDRERRQGFRFSIMDLFFLTFSTALFVSAMRLLWPASFSAPVVANLLLVSGFGLCATLPIGAIAVCVFNPLFTVSRVAVVLVAITLCCALVVHYFSFGSVIQFVSIFLAVQVSCITSMLVLKYYGYRFQFEKRGITMR